MQFTLTIDCNNAAFVGDGQDPTHEIRRILARLADGENGVRLDDGRLLPHTRSVLDLNGNRVGSWAIKEDQ